MTTALGLFKFVGMLLGLRNATQTFQRLADHVLRGFKCCFSYIDNLLIVIKSRAEHLYYLRQVFERQDHTTINCTNSVFGKSKLNFLGRKVTATGILPLSEKVSVI